MPATLQAACPTCNKSIKATMDLVGKKVRCKGCGHVYPIATNGNGPLSSPTLKTRRDPLEDTPAHGAYDLIDEDQDKPRCPHCGHTLSSSGAALCVHCGFNLQTRQRLHTRKIVETSAVSRVGWLLPGFLALVGVFALLAADLFCWYELPSRVAGTQVEWLGAQGTRVWLLVLSAFLIAVLARFAFRRLVLQPIPPERVLHTTEDE